MRGDLAAGLAECERGLALVAPHGVVQSTSALPWTALANAYIDTLVELGRCEQAQDYGERALQTCAQLGLLEMRFEVARSLALAEAKLGDVTGAAARLDAIIAGQQAYGGHGLILGASYEARTRVAIWAHDEAAVERFGQLAAHEYRHGRTTPLGARYARLMEDVRAAGMRALPQLGAFAVTMAPTSAHHHAHSAIESTITSAMSSAEDGASRAQVALALVCDAHAAPAGHLYVLRDEGLVLAASSPGCEPDEQLRRFVTAFWERQLLEPELPTAFVPEGSPVPGSSSEVWTDRKGTTYHPVLISAAAGKDKLHVGVAAVVPGAQPSTNARATQVTVTVGSYLLHSGDAVGVEA